MMVIVDSPVMRKERASSWERMKFVVHERENQVCGNSKLCVGDFQLPSDVCRKSAFVKKMKFSGMINVHESDSRMCGEGKVCVCDIGFESGV